MHCSSRFYDVRMVTWKHLNMAQKKWRQARETWLGNVWVGLASSQMGIQTPNIVFFSTNVQTHCHYTHQITWHSKDLLSIYSKSSSLSWLMYTKSLWEFITGNQQAWESCADWRNYADCRVTIRGKTVSMYIFDIRLKTPISSVSILMSESRRW